MFASSYSLPNNLFLLLRDLIHQRTGLFYDANNQDVLASKLSERLSDLGLGSFLDYYYLLKYDAQADAEWGQLMNALTVRETFFWREIDQIRAFVDVLMPQYASQKPHAPLRIWSAACATGEEPLSIAIALTEAGWFERMPITIAASDISSVAIETAEQGIYKERALRNLPAPLRHKYFVPQGKHWKISPELHKRITWSEANLMDSAAITQQSAADVIFCRNVFIYFSDEAIQATLQHFYQHMPTPGYLMVGVSESLLRLTRNFRLEEVGGAFIYVK